MIFSMVTMANGIARGRVRTTTTVTESRKMAAIIQIIAWQRHATLVYCVLLWYWASMLWAIDTCQNIIICWPVSCDHSLGSGLELIEVSVFSFDTAKN